MTVATETIRGTYLVEGQAQKEARSNEWFDQLALNLAGYLSKDVGGAGTLTLTNMVGGEAHHAMLRFTGALTGARTILVPSAQRLYFVGNLTTGAFSLTVSTAEGSGAVIPQNSWLILLCDGVNITAPAFTSGSVNIPPASEVVEGVTRYGTTADHTAGTRDDVATTPLKLQQRLDAVLAGKQPSDPTLSALAGLSTSANQLAYFTGVDAAALTPLTAFARSLLDDADATAGRATLLLGALAVLNSVGTAQLDNDAVTYAKLQNVTSPRLLGRATTGAGDAEELTLGTGLSFTGTILNASSTPPGGTSGQAQYHNGSGGFAGSSGLVLSATQITTIDLASPLPVSEGGTGGGDAATARTNLGVLAGAAGTPLSVVRYAASGTSLETSSIQTLDTGEVGIGGAPVSGTALTISGALSVSDASTTRSNLDLGTGDTPQFARLGLGFAAPSAARVVMTRASEQKLLLFGEAVGERYGLAVGNADIQMFVPASSAANRLNFGTMGTDGSTYTSQMSLYTQTGNLVLGASAQGTGLTRGLILVSGTAPTTSPADAVQLWSADTGGLALQAGLHLRTENGTQHVLGNTVGLNTLCAATLGSGASYQALNVKGSTLYVGQSSVQERAQVMVSSTWISSTDASRTARLTLSAYDATAAREGMRMEADGTAARLGFFGQAAVVRQTVPAAATDAGTTQALANSLRTALVNLGLCV